MARLPTYTSQVGIQPAGAPSVPDQGAVGRALSGAGNAIQGLGGQLSDLDLRYAQLQKQKQTFNTENGIDTFKQQQNGALQTDLDHAPADGSNFTVTSMQRYDKDQETFISSLPSDQQERARQQLAPFRQGYLNLAAQKEHGLTAANSTKILGDNYTSTLNAVNSDPANRDKYLAGLKQRVDLAPGLSAAEKDDIYRNAEKGVAIQYVKALAPADPDKVRQLQGMPAAGQGGGQVRSNVLLAAISKGEGAGDYNKVFANGEFGDTPKPVTQMTVDEAAQWADQHRHKNNPRNPHPAAPLGAYQFVGSTIKALKNQMGLSGNELMSPQLQDAMAWQNLKNTRGNPTAIRQQWTSWAGKSDAEIQQLWEQGFKQYEGHAPPSSYPTGGPAAAGALNEDKAGAPSGQSSSANSYTPTSDPVLSRLTPDDWNSLYNSARTQQNQNQAIARGNLEPVVQDATSALMTTGRYDGRMPTQIDFTAAYGPQEGAQRYSQFRQVQDIGQHIDAFKSMTPDQIQADIAAAKPVGAGEGFAMAQSRYEAMAKAGAATIKMRLDDPAGYVKSVNPQVAALWQNSNTADGYRTALAAMSAAQTQLGIAPQNQQLLPDDFTKQTIDTYKNDALTVQQRMAPVLNAVLRTSDPDQQKAIFGQLVKAGLPTTMTGAIEAYSRGDQGAGDRLMSAIMLAPSKIPTDGAVKAEAINTAVAAIMAPGQIGNMAYGLQNGNPDNIGRAQDGMEILRRAAQMRVAQGETNATKAVDDASKDLFGKQKAYSNTFGGMTFSAIIPDDANLGSLSRGVIAMRPQIEAAVARSSTEFVRQKNIAKGNPTTEAVMAADIKAHTSNVMNSGQIVNYGRDGFAFLDTYTNGFVPGADGKPLVFKLSDFEAADKAAQAQPQQSQGAPYFLGGAGQSGMNFLPPQQQAPAKPVSIPPPKPQAGGVPTSGNDAFRQATEMFGTNPENIGGPM